MVRRARSWQATPPTESLPLDQLPVSALKMVLKKHQTFIVAREKYEVAAAAYRVRCDGEKSEVAARLAPFDQQMAKRTEQVSALEAKLQPLRLGLLGKLFSEPSVTYLNTRYRTEAAPLIQTLNALKAEQYRLAVEAEPLRKRLAELNSSSFGRAKSDLRSPSPIGKLTVQLKKFIFKLDEVDIARVQALIVEKIAESERERDVAKEKLESTKARAAAYDNKQRRQAQSIRNALRKQLIDMPYCPYCESPLALDIAHADHIYPVAKGGLSTRKNMVLICSSCNSAKSHLTLRVFLKRAGIDEETVHMNLERLGKDF